MTLQEILQILGGIGVIGSLIYVAIQIRNNSRAVRAATVLQISHTMMSSLFNMANSAELTGLVLRGGDDLSSLDRLDKARFRFHAMFILSFNQNIFIQHKIGTLKSDDWQSFKADLTSYFAMTGARAAWPLVRARFHPDFQAYVDLIVEQAATAATEVPELKPVKLAKKARRNKP